MQKKNIKKVLITGASGLIGEFLCESFLKKGFKVIGVCRGKSADNNLLKLTEDNKEMFFLYNLDLTVNKEILKLVESLREDHNLPNFLINNARDLGNLQVDNNGIVSRNSFIEEFNLAIVGHYDLTMSLVKIEDSELEKVVNIGSIYGSIVPRKKLYKNLDKESPIHYGVTKSALVHMTKELAVRLSDKKILVNCVSFGGVEGRVSKKFKEEYESLCPLGRMLNKSDVTEPVHFLLSNKVKNITGQNIIVDGGFSLQ